MEVDSSIVTPPENDDDVELQILHHACTECGRTYSTGPNLNRHMRKKHGGYYSVSSHIMCPLCKDEDILSKKAFEMHLVESHGIDLDKEILSFPNKGAFQQWKDNMEKETTSHYTASKSTTVRNGVAISYLYCHRSGRYKGRGNRKRKMKKFGTNKINGNCPSMLKIKRNANEEEDSYFEVEFVKTHVGHTHDITRIRLSQVEKERIALQLSNGVPISRIVREARKAGLEMDKPDRIHLLTRKDVQNIQKQFNINVEKTSNGAAEDDSVDADNGSLWVEEVPIQAEEPQQQVVETSEIYSVQTLPQPQNDYLLVIMNETLKDSHENDAEVSSRPPKESSTKELNLRNRIMNVCNEFMKDAQESPLEDLEALAKALKSARASYSRFKSKKTKSLKPTVVNKDPEQNVQCTTLFLQNAVPGNLTNNYEIINGSIENNAESCSVLFRTVSGNFSYNLNSQTIEQ